MEYECTEIFFRIDSEKVILVTKKMVNINNKVEIDKSKRTCEKLAQMSLEGYKVKDINLLSQDELMYYLKAAGFFSDEEQPVSGGFSRSRRG